MGEKYRGFMKHIQWFPGHMTKAMRMMEESVGLVDGVIVVLDARARGNVQPKSRKAVRNEARAVYPE